MSDTTTLNNLFPLGEDETEYRKLSSEFVSV